jgi:hypothetical protein
METRLSALERSHVSLKRDQLAKNARSDQTEVEFNPSSIGDQNDPRVNAENQTAEPKDQEASRCRSQAGQTAGEAGIGGAGREERKGADGKVKEVKLAGEVEDRPKAEVPARSPLPGALRHLGLGHLDFKGPPQLSVRHASAAALESSNLWMA